MLTPSCVVAGSDIEDDRDEVSDVLHGDGLGVQVEDDSGLVEQHGLMSVRCLIGDSREVITGVLLVGVRRGALALLCGAR